MSHVHEHEIAEQIRRKSSLKCLSFELNTKGWMGPGAYISISSILRNAQYHTYIIYRLIGHRSAVFKIHTNKHSIGISLPANPSIGERGDAP